MSGTLPIVCPYCGMVARREAGAVNRARRKHAPVYCSRSCFGLARRLHRTDEEKRQSKAAYDALRRVELADELRVTKAEYFQRTYDPAHARVQRKARAQYHVQYCRRYYADPEKKRAKVKYDQWRRAEMRAGEYAECLILLNELCKEIRAREPSWYERAKAKGYYNTINERTRHDRQERSAVA